MIYLVKQIDFDNLENHDPEYETLLGYFADSQDAINYVNKLNAKTPKYQSYIGRDYPIFSITEVNNLKEDEKPSGELPDDDLPF